MYYCQAEFEQYTAPSAAGRRSSPPRPLADLRHAGTVVALLGEALPCCLQDVGTGLLALSLWIHLYLLVEYRPVGMTLPRVPVPVKAGLARV